MSGGRVHGKIKGKDQGRVQAWVWIAVLVAAMAMPWAFYNYHTGRHDGFVVSMLSQMGMMTILALSYNMLLGQAGLFSLCHATFFGIGGYATIHFLTLAGDGSLPLPLELFPLLAGLSGLGLAIVFGYMATKQRATAFAMITLGIGELMTTAALMFHHFFGGEGGVNSNRMIGHSLFGFKYGASIQVYYLIVAWTVISALAMLYLTRTPLGRMANASRDNFERVQFMGYDPRMVRFLQFMLSGFFAGIGGGLYAITYEIVTFDALAAPLSANALLMAYIGGTSAFGGPILGAVLITLLQSGVSLMSNSWLVYVGALFICMVIYRAERNHGADRGARPDRARRAVRPVARALCEGAGARHHHGARLHRAGGTGVVPDHRRGAGQDAGAVRKQDRRSCAAAVAIRGPLPCRRRPVVRPGSPIVPPGLARADG